MRHYFSGTLLTVTILLGVAGSAAAAPFTLITLSAGDSVAFDFDFVDAGFPPPPPYAEVVMAATLADLDAGDSGIVQFWSELGASGTNFQTLNALGSLPGTVFEGVPSANDGIFSMTITMTAGSITLVDPIARGFDAEGAGTLPVFGLQVQQAPEPTTMMLLGLGLAGAAARRGMRRYSS